MAERERVAYVNGEFVPESEAKFHYRDGFISGDSVFDTARTYNGEIFKLDSHVDRTYRSAKYAGFDPGISKEEFKEAMRETVRRNWDTLPPGDDFWINARVSRGVRGADPPRPSILIETHELIWTRAKYYKEGLTIFTAGSVRRIPPWAWSPQAKIANRMNDRLASLEVYSEHPEAWVLMLNEEGNIAEGTGWNLFIVKDGQIYTPEMRWQLYGIGRETVIELAQGLDIPVHEKDFGLFECYTADELIVTASTTIILPGASIDGRRIADEIPGPITNRLLGGLSDMIGFDVVEQYLRHME